jgi:hypothetical protein
VGNAEPSPTMVRILIAVLTGESGHRGPDWSKRVGLEAGLELGGQIRPFGVDTI